MATEHTGPAADDRSGYDYRTGSETIPAGLAGLSDLVAGDVRFDEYSKQLYATDASAYEVTPIGVVYPTSTTDVATVMRHCAEHEIPVMPRGGGTSLAGQATNEAVVLDFTRYMTEVFAIDPDERTASAEVGVYLGDLNAECAPHGLKFAPDPAWGDKSALGGAIGNNSTGAHSLVYEKTDAYVEECEAVLADGTVTTFGEITLSELRDRADPDGDLEGRIHAIVAEVVDEHAETVEEAYPDLTRNVSGYNLDWIVEEAMEAKRAIEEGEADDVEGTINLARLLAGSEGTLAIVTEATVSLVEVPETKAVALLTYPDLLSAMRDVAPILEHGPAAVEAMDDVLLDLARQTEEFGPVVGMLPEGTDSVLLVEFYADSVEEGKEKVADLLVDRVPGVESEGEPSEGAAETTDAPVEATTAMEAYDAAKRAQFWKMRKSGLPILLSRTSDEKHIAFIEDTAIPAEHLPAFVEGFEEILEAEGTFATYYAHAGPGVLHIRPLINTKTEEGLASFEAIADGVTDLVVEYGGSVSGEHGDGRARTQWNRKLYGEEVFGLFKELKTAFDPDWLLNPGQVCGDISMTENLRFDPAYEFETGFEPVLNWENENGFQGMVELCHGCGGCRGPQHTTGGVMCPTFRAAEEEITSTRGRANMLRQAMSGDLPDEQFSDEFITEVLDLCIGCKGCKIDCPSGVDMAKLKAEVTHEYHRREGAEARSKLFANFDRLAPLASATAPVSNLLSSLPGSGLLAEKTMGIARERSLPEFQRETLRDWFEARDGSSVPEDGADRRALLVPDTYTNHVHPEVGRAAVRVLENAGVHVSLPEEVGDSGRAAFSKGFLDEAGTLATENVTALAPRIEEGWDVVVVEPSDAVMFQSDYRDLLSGRFVDLVSENTYGVMEYVDAFGLDVPDGSGERLTYHGHCHQKATAKDHHTAAVLTRAGFEVDVLDSGCCGMAGSFGYEAEHYAMSQAIGSILFSQIDRSGGRVVAPGTSCRTQIGDEYGEEPPHPVELLAESL